MRLGPSNRLASVRALALIALVSSCSERDPTAPLDESLSRLVIVSAPS